jgi:hypothetical protein
MSRSVAGGKLQMELELHGKLFFENSESDTCKFQKNQKNILDVDNLLNSCKISIKKIAKWLLMY